MASPMHTEEHVAFEHWWEHFNIKCPNSLPDEMRDWMRLAWKAGALWGFRNARLQVGAQAGSCPECDPAS